MLVNWATDLFDVTIISSPRVLTIGSTLLLQTENTKILALFIVAVSVQYLFCCFTKRKYQNTAQFHLGGFCLIPFFVIKAKVTMIIICWWNKKPILLNQVQECLRIVHLCCFRQKIRKHWPIYSGSFRAMSGFTQVNTKSRSNVVWAFSV